MAGFGRKRFGGGAHKKGRGRQRSEEEVQELKIPAQDEHIGRVVKVAGTTKFLVKCNDDKERLCTIPGRLRRRFWIKANDIVIVKPWVVQSDERGDIVWRYSVLDTNRLKEIGALQGV
jgi:translation initiation factor 1A